MILDSVYGMEVHFMIFFLRYKTLDADEAEEKFAQRGKVLNKEQTIGFPFYCLLTL
jgi:hypothetical protein